MRLARSYPTAYRASAARRGIGVPNAAPPGTGRPGPANDNWRPPTPANDNVRLPGPLRPEPSRTPAKALPINPRGLAKLGPLAVGFFVGDMLTEALWPWFSQSRIAQSYWEMNGHTFICGGPGQIAALAGGCPQIGSRIVYQTISGPFTCSCFGPSCTCTTSWFIDPLNAGPPAGYFTGQMTGRSQVSTANPAPPQAQIPRPQFMPGSQQAPAYIPQVPRSPNQHGLPILQGVPAPRPVPYIASPHVASEPYVSQAPARQAGNSLARPGYGNQFIRRGWWGIPPNLIPVAPVPDGEAPPNSVPKIAPDIVAQPGKAVARQPLPDVAFQRKPPKGEKERKFRLLNKNGALARIISTFTESADVIDAFYKALDPKCIKKKRASLGSRAPAPLKDLTPQGKAASIYRYLDCLDGRAAVWNVIEEQVQDMFWGQVGKHMGKSARNAYEQGYSDGRGWQIGPWDTAMERLPDYAAQQRAAAVRTEIYVNRYLQEERRKRRLQGRPPHWSLSGRTDLRSIQQASFIGLRQ